MSPSMPDDWFGFGRFEELLFEFIIFVFRLPFLFWVLEFDDFFAGRWFLKVPYSATLVLVTTHAGNSSSMISTWPIQSPSPSSFPAFFTRSTTSPWSSKTISAKCFPSGPLIFPRFLSAPPSLAASDSSLTSPSWVAALLVWLLMRLTGAIPGSSYFGINSRDLFERYYLFIHSQFWCYFALSASLEFPNFSDLPS